MCGIAGYWLSKGTQSIDLIQAMNRLQKRRGPDDEGFWFWQNGADEGTAWAGEDTVPTLKKQLPDIRHKDFIPHQLAFAHRRYAVIDLSDAGHQPLLLGQYALIYNGEIYNHADLRSELQTRGVVFFNNTDSEVIVRSYEYWGTACFERFRGFFAIVLFDLRTQMLLFARDPLGKAPLYLLQRADAWYFASDIKPLLEACPEERAKVRTASVMNYLQSGLRDFNYQTFWENINSVPAATWIRLHLKTGRVEQQTYWQLPERSHEKRTAQEASSVLYDLLRQSLQRRRVADRQVGFTLSGGLDSSALAAVYAQWPNAGKVPAFTVRHKDPAYDETPFAKMVVNAYPAHFEHIIIDGDAYDLIPEWDSFFDIQEEPFHDPALYVDFSQQKILKSHGVDVNINGAGGDELLAGYPAYFLPHLRWLKGQGVGSFPQMATDVKGIFNNLTFSEMWGAWQKRKRRNTPDNHPFFRIQVAAAPAISPDFEVSMRQRMGTWLMHYWLRSQHKNYMQVPVEPRLPYLDIDLVNYCFTLSPGLLIRDGWTKYLLRHAMRNHLPLNVLWRKRKMGFPFDTKNWLLRHETALKTLFLRDHDNPWMDTRAIRDSYSLLLRSDPQMLWRMACLSGWHLRIIRGQSFGL